MTISTPAACVRSPSVTAALLLLVTLPVSAQQEDNAYARWATGLREAQPDPARGAQVENVTLQRDEGTFTFLSGQIHLLEAVEGRTYGAVFVGEGRFTMKAPIPVEQAQLRRVLDTDDGRDEVDAPFRTAVLFFTDWTDQDLGTAVQWGPLEPPNDARREVEEALKYVSDDEGWVSRDLMVPLLNGAAGMFYAHVAEDRGDPWMFFVNPHYFEEISVYRRADGRGQRREVVSRFHRRADYASGRSMPAEALDLVRVAGYRIDSTIEDNLDFRGTAAVSLVRQSPGATWLPFRLYSQLEVDSVVWSNGERADFARVEDRTDLWLDLSAAPADSSEVVFHYHGDVLDQEDGLWVQVVAHRTWFPVYEYDRPIPYTLRFTTPDKLRIAAIGTQVSEARDSDGNVTTVWETPPVRQVTFNVGEFEELQTSGGEVDLRVQVDERAHDVLAARLAERNVTLFTQEDMASNVIGDLERAFLFYGEVFGPTPVDAFVATEIFASHGEAFPGLVLLAWSTFQYTSERGYDEMFRAHEVAHQWWGIGVRPATYHDQWLAEGFSEFAGLWYAARVHGSLDMYTRRLSETREELLRRRDEAAPLWLGPRVATSEHPEDHSLVVYQKGAWVLHMLRTMLTDENGSDAVFGEIMKSFYQTHYGGSATTEQLRQVAEEKIGADMGWFFDQWVYGSAIPTYTFSHTFEDQPDGSVKARIRVVQENVPDDFRMLVPLYLDFGDEGSATLKVNVAGPLTEAELPLLPRRPDEIVFNPFEAVLAETKTERWKGG